MVLLDKPEPEMVMQQGVQQLYDGCNFQVGIRPDGSHAMVAYTAELISLDPMMEKVLVESKSREGVVYESLRFFQGRGI